jgi:hypothetical protein
MNVRLVGLSRQHLLDFIDERDVVVEDLVDRLKRKLHHVLNVGPLVLLLERLVIMSGRCLLT